MFLKKIKAANAAFIFTYFVKINDNSLDPNQSI